MKARKLMLMLMVLLFIGGGAYAQDANGDANESKRAEKRKQRRAKIKRAKIAFLTKELNLTEAEAQAFWPVYNENEQKREEIHKRFRSVMKKYKKKNIDELTDEQAKEVVEAHQKMKDEMHAQDKAYYEKLKKVLPIKKIAKYYKAEKKFKKKMLRRMRKRGKHGPHGPGGGGPPQR